MTVSSLQPITNERITYLLYFLQGQQLWKLDDSRLKNKAAKDEEWCLTINENTEWNLKTLDVTGRTVLIENKSTNMVLTVQESRKVIEEQYGDVNERTRQIWYKGKPNRKGYFTLTNNDTVMLLTATSSNEIMVRGNLINLTILSSYDYDDSRYMPNSTRYARSFGYLPYSMYIVF